MHADDAASSVGRGPSELAVMTESSPVALRGTTTQSRDRTASRSYSVGDEDPSASQADDIMSPTNVAQSANLQSGYDGVGSDSGEHLNLEIAEIPGDLQQDGIDLIDETGTINTVGSGQSVSRKQRLHQTVSIHVANDSDEVPKQHVDEKDLPLQCHFRFSEHAPQPPGLMNAAVAGGNNPLRPITINLDVAACGGGIVTHEKFNGLPLHTNDLESLRPHLIHFCRAYNVQMVCSCSE